MDSLTQIVLGASVAEAVAGKKMGGKAALWGAICGTIPDLDVFIRFTSDPIHGALLHRGFSHSIVFALIAGPGIGWLLYRIYKRKYQLKTWILLCFLAIVTHPILDTFTNYGTQLFWPFDNRLSTNSIFVIDPIYTLPFLIFLIFSLVKKRTHPKRSKWNKIGLIYSTGYLFLALTIKLIILYNTPKYFNNYAIKNEKTLVTPMPLTSFYWMLIVEDDKNYYVGYKSIFYSFNSAHIDTVPKNDHLIKNLNDKNDYLKTINFISKEFVAYEQSGDSLIAYDLRFGLTNKLTNDVIQVPVRGYGLVVDNDSVKKSYIYMPKSGFQQLNFASYWQKVFKKDENSNSNSNTHSN